MAQHLDFSIKSNILFAAKNNNTIRTRLGKFAEEPVGRPHINPTYQEIDRKCKFLTLQDRLQLKNK